MSLKWISEMTGLSIATVSHALNGTRAVSPENKAKVLEAAKKIDYRPNMAAKTLKTNKSDTIALVIPRVEPGKPTNYFYMDVIAGVHACLNENKYSLIICAYQETKKDGSVLSLGILEKHWVDGVLLVPNSMERQSIAEIEKTNVPIVLIDREINDSMYDFVVSDNEKGAFEAVKLMHEKGKRRIAFVGSMLRTSASYKRYLGYKKCLVEFGFPENRDLIILNEQQSIENGMKSAEHLMNANADGVLVSDNILTIGVFRYFKKHGICMPEEISLIGYDDYEWMEDVEPSITTVSQKPYEMGYRAAGILISRLQNRGPQERICSMLETKLMQRKSH